MKRIIYSAAIIASLIAVSCKHQQAVSTSASGSSSSTQTSNSGNVTTTVSTTTDTMVTTTVGAESNTNTTTVVDSSNLYRVTISFISRGEGIDYKTLEATEAWIKNQPKTPAYVKTHWGREGETNLCLKLNELSTREQEIFVRDLRTQLTDKQLVIIAEYAECKGKAE